MLSCADHSIRLLRLPGPRVGIHTPSIGSELVQVRSRIIAAAAAPAGRDRVGLIAARNRHYVRLSTGNISAARCAL